MSRVFVKVRGGGKGARAAQCRAGRDAPSGGLLARFSSSPHRPRVSQFGTHRKVTRTQESRPRSSLSKLAGAPFSSLSQLCFVFVRFIRIFTRAAAATRGTAALRRFSSIYFTFIVLCWTIVSRASQVCGNNGSQRGRKSRNYD